LQFFVLKEVSCFGLRVAGSRFQVVTPNTDYRIPITSYSTITFLTALELSME